MHCDKIQMLEKFSSDKINVTFIHKPQVITVLVLNCDSYKS